MLLNDMYTQIQVSFHIQNTSYMSVAKPLQNCKLLGKPKTSKYKSVANWGSMY